MKKCVFSKRKFVSVDGSAINTVIEVEPIGHIFWSFNLIENGDILFKVKRNIFRLGYVYDCFLKQKKIGSIKHATFKGFYYASIAGEILKYDGDGKSFEITFQEQQLLTGKIKNRLAAVDDLEMSISINSSEYLYQCFSMIYLRELHKRHIYS